MTQADSTRSVPVAIIGMGCLFPMADDLERYWSNIRARLDAITEVPPSHWRAEDYHDPDPKAPDRVYAHRGGFLSPVDFPLMDFGIAPHAVEATDTTQLLGLIVARKALEDAGYGTGRDFDRDRVSVILGVTGTLELVIPLGARLGHPIWRRALADSGVDATTAERVVKRISDSYVGWQEASFPGLLGNVAAGRIANRLDLGGTNCVVDAACASSLGAVNLAMHELATGRCDVALSGGLDTFNDIFMYMCFSKTPALSPTGHARPFSAAGDGTTLGEGLGVLVLKRLEDAKRDGDKIYAVIRSMGTASDGKGQSIYAPKADGQAKALRQAYDLAGVEPGTVELVEAHGTGTRVGDGVEVEALEQVYRGGRSKGRWCALGSVKSQIGHTKAAAGSAGLIKAALALHHKVLPPTIKVDQPIERLRSDDSPFYVNTDSRPWIAPDGHPRRAAVSAFGFGGSNFHCVLEEAEADRTAIDWGGDVQILAYSSDDKQPLADSLPKWSGQTGWVEIRAEGRRSRRAFRSKHRHRLLIVAKRGEFEPSRLVDEARARLASGDKAVAPSPESRRIFLGAGEAEGRLAFLFPGQGSQYVGMLRDLACRFPRMLSALELADGATEIDGGRLVDLIYPRSVFSDDERRRLAEELRDTRAAQPAIGAVSLGLLRILEDFGVQPEMVAGHSFGELTALLAAGRIDDETFAALASERGALMAHCAEELEPGAMLAAFAPADQLAKLISERGLDVVIANKNAPRQSVLSGSRDEIDRAERMLAEAGVSAKRLPVSAAFHSRFVSEASAPFRAVLDGAAMREGTIPVFANSTAAAYPRSNAEAKAILADQLAQPVEFAAMIEAMHRDGARTFVEVGPDSKLGGLVGSILEGEDHQVVAVDSSRGGADDLVGLASALATLAATGREVDLSPWDGAYEPPAPTGKKKGLTVPVSGAHPAPKPPKAPIAPAPVAPKPKAEPTAPRPNGPSQPVAAPVSAGDAIAPRRPESKSPVERTMNPSETQTFASTNGHAAHGSTKPSSTPAAPAPAPAPVPSPASPPAPRSVPADALRQTHEHLIALQQLAQQTARLHQQFLEGQETAQRTFQTLLEQQAGLASGPAVAPRPVQSIAAPAPEVARRPAPTQAAPAPAPHPVIEPAPAPVIQEAPAPVVNGRRSEAPAPVKPEPAPAPAPAPVAPKSNVGEILLAVVAEKTGYPVDMLELEMRLDDDLGIDSIKRVEILSALQEQLPGAPAVRPDQLGAIGSLGDIVELLDAGASAQPAAPAPAPAPAPSSSPTPAGGAVADALLETVAEKTGYPVDMLELEMRLDDDLGIDSIKRVEILSALQERLPEVPAVRPDQLGAIGTLGDIVELLGAGAPVQPAAPAPAPVPAPSSSPAPVGGALAETLLEIVAEKTGYPVDMLELEMKLDDDLGIDSIKRVEILSALQERLPEVPAVRPDQLGSIGSLGDIVELLGASVQAPEPAPAPETIEAIEATKPEPIAEAPARLDRLAARPLPLDHPERREAVALPAGAEVWVVDEGSSLTAALESALNERGFRARVVSLDGLEGAAPAGLILTAPASGADSTFVKRAFRLIRSVGPKLREQPTAALVTVSRLDGRFGLEGLDPAVEPYSGALAGLAKTAGWEWPEVHCKAVDLDRSFADVNEAARRIVEELSRVGPAEVGLSADRTIQVELDRADWPAGNHRRWPALDAGDLVIVTGGARGVTAEAAVAMAAEFQPTLLLLGRTPAPEAEPDWLAGLSDEAEIRTAIRTQSTESLTPQKLNERFRQIIAQREVARNLDRIREAGGEVIYRAVDVRDREAVRRVVEEVQATHGPVRGLIHAAGVLADRRIEDQTDAQFDMVYDTKIDGLLAVFDALDSQALRVLALYSSSTARFGRLGQVAYAAANEVLNKWAQVQARRLPDCRVASFNWGPWDGGMVTPSLRSLFESEGLGLIPLAAGADLVVRELRESRENPVEVVVLADPSPSDSDRNGDAAQAPSSEPTSAADADLHPAFQRVVDLQALPILRSHVIDGHPVLPMALIMEWLGEAAAHRHPGLVVQGVDDLRLFKGVVLRDRSPITVSLLAGRGDREGSTLIVPVEMRGALEDGREIVHAKAMVHLADRHPEGSRSLPDRDLPPMDLDQDDVYERILFHGPDMRAIEQIEGRDDQTIAAKIATSPAPADWIAKPLRGQWLTDPLAVDAAFQVMVLWCRERTGSNSLPTAVGSYRQFQRRFPTDGVRVVINARQASDHRGVADIEFIDARGELVARIDSYECVIDASLNQAFLRNQLARLETAPK